MNEIDWGKAPEGATHYNHTCSGWYKVTRIGAVFFWNGHTSEWRPARFWDDRKHDCIQRPTTPSWSGEGIPPVGVRVLIMNPEKFAITDYGQEFVGEECTVRAVFVNDLDYRMVAVEKVGGACCCFLSEMCFPIRTHEQIAADEREAAIDAMLAATPAPGSDISLRVCEQLYDAGYRKP